MLKKNLIKTILVEFDYSDRYSSQSKISDFENIYQRFFLKPGAQIFVDYGWDTSDIYDPNELFITDNDDLKKSQNSTGLILSVGTQNKNGLEVKHALEKQSIVFDHVAVTNIAPFSGKLADFMTKYDYIITMEEGIITGGFASLISENLIQRSSYPKTLQIGLPKKFIEHGTRDYIYQKFAQQVLSKKYRSCQYSELPVYEMMLYVQLGDNYCIQPTQF